jgi:ATP-dependent protease HslVU (ClpYQ) peptidase subunit
MTAEVSIMNRNGIALAADSAVSIGNQKIYTSADKLFQLSNTAPVGTMVFGQASFLNVPWETVVKTYRKHLGNKSFPHLQDYADDFISYLKTSRTMFSVKEQRKFVYSVLCN